MAAEHLTGSIGMTAVSIFHEYSFRANFERRHHPLDQIAHSDTNFVDRLGYKSRFESYANSSFLDEYAHMTSQEIAIYKRVS